MNREGRSSGVVDKRLRFSQRELERFLAKARRAAGITGAVGLLLADDAALKALNCNYRKKNKPTDVLSFPAAAGPSSGNLAGDLAISVETAQRQAAEHGHSLAAELKILVLHGVLHLAGHDHERDGGAMARKERRLRRELGLPSGLIERAGNISSERKSLNLAKQRRSTKSAGGQR
jgi:probable rRNA maturation factor